jgi:hypothetical protein
MHQIRYYPRMGDIEFISYELFRVETPNGPASSPLIDWGWGSSGRSEPALSPACPARSR